MGKLAYWPNEFVPTVGSNSFDQRSFIVTVIQMQSQWGPARNELATVYRAIRMMTAGNRGGAIDLMVQGMTPQAQCVTGRWPNEFGPTTVIYPLDLGKSHEKNAHDRQAGKLLKFPGGHGCCQ